MSSAGLLALAVLAAFVVADVGGYLSAGLQAATGADAAALAAAPLTFQDFGPGSSPSAAAAEFAARNGNSLVTCRCPRDHSWTPRIVEVVVEREVRLLLFGSRRVRAVGRAEFVPTRLH